MHLIFVFEQMNKDNQNKSAGAFSGWHSLPKGRAGMGLLTIVIPVFNRKEYLKRTLDSIPDDYPLIVVDNGSTDGSYEFCKMYALNNHRTRMVVEREFIPGAAAARNRGLSLCKTPWIYFFDSDDVFTGLPESWDENLDMVCFPVNMQVGSRVKVRDYEPVSTPHTHILNSMLGTHSMLFRTEWLKGIGGWNNDCKIWIDWELGLRALLHHPRMAWLTAKTYHLVHVHPNSITGANVSDKYKQRLAALAIAFQDIHKYGNDDTRCMFAFFLRCYIFAGELLKEGNKQASDEVMKFIYDHFDTNSMSHKLGRLLRWYVSKGGRGAWKVALRLVDRI